MISFPEFYIVAGNIQIIGRECELERPGNRKSEKDHKKNCILGSFGHGLEGPKIVILISPTCTLADGTMLCGLSYD